MKGFDTSTSRIEIGISAGSKLMNMRELSRLFPASLGICIHETYRCI